MDTETAKKVADEERNMKAAGAHHSAQELADQLHLVYWMYQRSEGTYDYMKRAAKETYQELTVKLQEAGIL